MFQAPSRRFPRFGPGALSVPVFVLITWQIAADGPLRAADERAGRAVLGGSGARAAEFFADLGNTAVALPVLTVIVVCITLLGRGSPRAWLPPLSAVLVSAAVPAVVIPLKELIGRHGPAGAHAAGYYPSGHAATAAVAYGTAALLVLPWLRTPSTRRALVIGVPLLNLAVGLGLVRRGYHWPLDVLASWCLSAVLLQVVASVMTRYGRTGPKRPGTALEGLRQRNAQPK